MKSSIRASRGSGSTKQLVERLIRAGWTPDNRHPFKAKRRRQRQAVEVEVEIV